MPTPRAEVPIVSLGNVALEAGEVNGWALKAGVRPYERTVSLTTGMGGGPNRAKALYEQEQPMQMTMWTQHVVGNDRVSQRIGIQGIYAVEWIKSNAFLNQIVLKDRRWKWEGKAHTRRYNVKRRLNDAEIIEAGGTFDTAGSKSVVIADTPGALDVRQDYLKIPKYRYHKWSLNPETDEPWTALEIAEAILTDPDQGLEPDGGYRGRLHQLADNGYQPDEEVILADSATEMLKRALTFARAEVAVMEDGFVYLYPYDVSDPRKFLPAGAPYSTESELLYQRNLDRIRPQKVYIHFEVEREYWFEIEQPDTEYAENYPLLTNVAPLYRNETLTVTLPDGTQESREYAAGTYIPIDVLAEAWRVAGQPFGGADSGALDEIVRVAWFDNFEAFYNHAYMLATYGSFSSDPTGLLRAQTFREHWRQTYMMSDWYIERMVRVRDELASVVNNINGALPNLLE